MSSSCRGFYSVYLLVSCDTYSAMQRQTAVTAYLKSKQLPLFAFAGDYGNSLERITEKKIQLPWVMPPHILYIFKFTKHWCIVFHAEMSLYESVFSLRGLPAASRHYKRHGDLVHDSCPRQYLTYNNINPTIFQIIELYNSAQFMLD